MITRTPQRECYTGADAIEPLMPMVGWTRPRAADEQGLGAHRHPGVWELCWLRRGEVDWWVGDEAHTVPQGHCYVTRPEELHGGDHGVLQPCELFWLHLRLPAGGVPGWPDLERHLLALPRVFRGEPGLAAAWWAVIGELRARDAHSPAAEAAAAVRLVAALLRAAARHAPRATSPGIARAIALAAARLDQPLRVAALARAAGLSPSRFHDRFVAEIGEAPATWLRRLRLRRAKQLLAAGRPVTAVAHDLGFPSSQWFATVFRRHLGVAPSAWRERRTPT